MNNRQSAEGVHLLDLFYHSGIIIVIPLGQSDSLLHLLQCVFQHLGELGRHFLNPLSQLCNLILLVLQLLVLLLLVLYSALPHVPVAFCSTYLTRHCTIFAFVCIDASLPIYIRSNVHNGEHLLLLSFQIPL
jgi:hypothetical protein